MASEAGFTTTDGFVGDVFAWLTAVRDDHDLPALAFAVAYTIAQHINRETRVCWPSAVRIGELVGRDERNVRSAIKALIKRGHLIVAKHRGGGGSTHYQMPVVSRAERAKSPGPLDGETSAERAKSPGPQGSQQGSERAKSPGSPGSRNKAERAKSPGRSGQNRPPNQPQEPISSESAAPQPPRGGGEGEIGNQDRVDPFLDPAEVASADRRQALDATWFSIVGPDLAGKLGSNTTPLHAAIASGEVKAEDVAAGIREGIAKGDSVPGSWRWFVGWARGAAKARYGTDPKAAPTPQAFGRPAENLIRLEGGVKRTREFLEAEVAAWHEGHTWQAHLGFPPDHEFCSLPADLRGPRRPPTAPAVQMTVLRDRD